MLKLTRDELSRALSGLSLEDKRELLELLEQLEEQKPEPVVDIRPSLESFCDQIRDEVAAKSGNRDGYLAADAAHQAAVKRITARLARERPNLDAPPSLEALCQDFQEVTELARSEGFPPAEVRPPEPATEPDDPLDRLRRSAVRRAPLARDELLDVVLGRTEEQEQQRRAEERAQRAAATEVVDKLDGFRGIGPLSYPPAFEDS
jgi:hypothetical protein